MIHQKYIAEFLRTGPWFKHLLMTTSKSVRREGSTFDKDLFWGKHFFENIQRHEWLSLAGYDSGHICGGKMCTNIHEARLRKFASK